MADELEQVRVEIEEGFEDIISWLRCEGYEKYKEARRISDEESREDPESEPFKSKYAARDLFCELKTKLESFNQSGEEPSERLMALSACVEYQLGLNYVDTEELSTGEEHLMRSFELLERYRLDRRCCSTVLHCLNQMGILWSRRGDPEKALGFLQEGEQLYHSFTKDIGGSPFGLHEIFSLDDQVLSEHEREREFELAFTHTLYYLAQVYAAQGENTKSAVYCQTTLQRQLDTRQYDPVDWALNCATLSQYYITQTNYNMARHCLACASCVFSQAEAADVFEPVTEEDGEEERQRKERIPQRKADIARCWSKYCIDLLKLSQEKCVQDMKSDQEERDRSSGGADGQQTAQEPGGAEVGSAADGLTSGATLEPEKDPLRFGSLEVTSLEQEVPDQLVKTYEQARVLFLSGQKWLKEAKEYYLLDGHVTDYIEITQDCSQLFKILAFFDQDFERRCKMHKRRVDMLTEVLTELNPQHYLLVIRQLTFEVAETYSDMADLKVAIARESEAAPTPHAVKKINQNISQSIRFFKSFIDSLKHQGEMPKTFDEDLVRPALIAHFHVARLYSQLMCGDRQSKVDALRKTLDYYQYIVDYREANRDMPKVIEDEFGIALEMVRLLPLKMDRIMRTGKF